MTVDQILELVQTWSPAVFAVVGIVLIWLILEFVATLRKLRSTVKTLVKDIEPTLEHVDTLTAQLEPVLAKADPLVDRLSLTVDAANLEIMRLDGILEDVNDITGSLTTAGESIDKVTKTPVRLVSTTVDQVRSVFKSPKASEESVRLGKGETLEFTLPSPEGDSEPSAAVEAVQGATVSADAQAETVSNTSGKYYISYDLDPVSRGEAEPEEPEEPAEPEAVEAAEAVEELEEAAEAAEPEAVEA